MTLSDKPLITHRLEERLHALSHAVGVLLGMAGMVLLLLKNGRNAPYATESLVVYSLSVILLFSASTAYHLAQQPVWKKKQLSPQTLNLEP